MYACEPNDGVEPDFILSPNSTVPESIPSGESPSSDNTRKIGGFHCVCEDIGSDVYDYDNSRDDLSLLDDFFNDHDITNSDTDYH
ncbi:MAG: hypothetical protein ACOCZ5_02255 [bacterium]